ncbi:MAG: ferrous iron transport protein B [Anaerolineales bacterium]|nr:ferrous iron transport protein B [Anaerolineales bacterium]
MDCHTAPSASLSATGAIALIGHPNVGKSALFQRLTGQRVIVSNYPGTTVELTRGTARELPDTQIVDTPGVITLPPHTEDEVVTARVLLDEPLQALLQVGDAKNLRRTLLLTVQLAEMGRPLVLALNMMDEATARGIEVNVARLSAQLTFPVILTTATRGAGLPELTAALQATLHGVKPSQFRLSYPAEVEHTLTEICLRLPETPIAPRAMGLFWMSGDRVTAEWVEKRVEAKIFGELVNLRDALQRSFVEPLAFVIQKTRLQFVEQLVLGVVKETGHGGVGVGALLGKWATHPVWGWVVLAGALYGLYWFVGVFGAGTLVGLFEERLFGNVINPLVTGWITRHVPVPFLVDFLVGEYGLWTMGMTYAFALILPIVTTFFLAFGVLEDSGYLPRLAAFSNRLFQSLGLNGKAVLPMVLGLGCVTMATLTTRVLESKRDRFLVTLLLALAIPCSAQLGVVMGMLAGISLTATMIWGGVVTLVLLAVGWLAAKLTPGERSALLVELPPMRLPVLTNVVVKTLARLEWYLKEVVPLFLIGAAVMFGLDKLGVLDALSRAMEPLVVQWLGLPAEASSAFLMGFLRRDFGATGLFVMQSQGLLTPLQVVVAMVTVTLFVPCVASVLVIAKEHSNRVAAGMVALIFPVAFLIGGLLYRLLLLVGWGV